MDVILKVLQEAKTETFGEINMRRRLSIKDTSETRKTQYEQYYNNTLSAIPDDICQD